MRITSLTIQNQPPIKRFEVAELEDVIVIAGPNGVGKTNLLNHILTLFRQPGFNKNISCVVQATSESEIAAWGGCKELRTAVPSESNTLRSFLQRNQKRGQLRSGVLNFDAARVFEAVQPYTFSFDFRDPFEEDQNWETTYTPARSRFQDVVHSLYRKVRSQKEEISTKALALQKAGSTTMELDFTDPILKFKDAFQKLLPGKTLCSLDEQRQQILFTTADGTELPLDRLSSGEKEVVTVVFDFLLRDPQDSIIVFDEPELHLHPELCYRLLRTLRDSGARNQFVFCTHSPEIISASLDQSVIFVAPPKVGGENQALRVRQDDKVTHILHLLGQSVGVVSLGRKIVLIEGTDGSLDKQTYGAILGSAANDLVLVPTGSKDTINVFLNALGTVLEKTIWGVDFFMLCDGDSLVDASIGLLKDHPRLRRLGRYHLENYFLDERVLARVFEVMGESEDSPWRDPVEIAQVLKAIAKERVSYAAALRVSHAVRTKIGQVDMMPGACHKLELTALQEAFEKQIDTEKRRVVEYMDGAAVKELAKREYERIDAALSGETWKKLVPAKQVLAVLASKAKVDLGRLKTAYIREARSASDDPFAEIREVFGYFSSYRDTGSGS